LGKTQNEDYPLVYISLTFWIVPNLAKEYIETVLLCEKFRRVKTLPQVTLFVTLLSQSFRAKFLYAKNA